MRVWTGFGSEHSMNLVMIGRFREPSQAEATKRLIDTIVQQAMSEPDVDRWESGPERKRFSEAFLKILSDAELHILGPDEIEQFKYDVSVNVQGANLTLKTDEVDVSGFLKVMLDRGAKVEVFSAHEYPQATEKPDAESA